MYQKITQNSPLILTMGTSLPTNPTDGQVFVLVDSLTAPTYSWQLRYVAAKASNKWIFIGGVPALRASGTGLGGSLESGSWADFTAVPSFTFPVTGSYRVGISATMTRDAVTTLNVGFLGYQINTGSDLGNFQATSGVASESLGQHYNSVYKESDVNVSASDVLNPRYRTINSVRISAARYTIWPLAIGG